ncbi:imidazole glycerol phosphate synthase cyclase subunit [alpha proteobacterium U9-1i]|nr:imidazole glycerol phosphate synthase cyclase subunit [alpha proteobacterium U9-1i]
MLETASADATQSAARRAHRPRVIPVLLLKGDLLYKSVQFKDHKYVGDPRIAVKIFNDKGCDELVLLDIKATNEQRTPNFQLIEEIASEAFMPVAYGGGVRSQEDFKKIIRLGVEKVILCSHAIENPSFVSEAARVHGSQSVVVCIDAKRNWMGKHQVMTRAGSTPASIDPVALAKQVAAAGAGEIIINSIDRDGTFKGYDLALTKAVSSAVNVPVIASGGAGSLEHLVQAIREGGASAAAAGSIFVFQGPHRAVLITFPEEKKLRAAFAS